MTETNKPPLRSNPQMNTAENITTADADRMALAAIQGR
jgi:hypothetical protein